MPATAAAPTLIKEIRRLHKQFPNLGKAKLQVMLQSWCGPQDIALPSASPLNRTIQEQFVDYHEEELFYDLPGFNRKLAGWLLDDNTVLPHHSLGLQSPVNYLIHNQPQCQRGWTYTWDCKRRWGIINHSPRPSIFSHGH
ncbi:hypothetical protein [Candidatus Spongiihabitans sp.]|uniref:hypothetical protein n=1 Tax=Candidatus Spongiihabitans sp. TaxID=3101308 RepID=UPI003C7A33B3